MNVAILRRLISPLLFCLCAFAPAQGQFQLKTRLTGTQTTLGVRQAGFPKRRDLSRTHILVQFSALPQADIISEIQRRGARIVSVLPRTGMIVSAPDSVDLNGLGIVRAVWLNASDKISPLLGESNPAPRQEKSQAILTARSGIFIVEFYSDVDPATARIALSDYGLQNLERPGLLQNDFLVAGRLSQIAQVAQLDEVAYIYPASRALTLGTPVYPCAGALTATGTVSQLSIPTYGDGWDGPGQGAIMIGYYFSSLTSLISPDLVQSEVLRAYQEWSKYVQVYFSPAASATANQNHQHHVRHRRSR